jgi:hypothetical protein
MEMSASHAQLETQTANISRSVPRAVARLHSVCRSDMHPAVYKLAVLCWAMLMAVFWITFFVSSNAIFMVTVSTFYAIMFFGIPFIFSRIAAKRKKPNFLSLGEFMRGRFDTIYGPIGGAEALLQVILVPLCLSIGGVAMMLIISYARVVH